jgi:hypothetical protein
MTMIARMLIAGGACMLGAIASASAQEFKDDKTAPISVEISPQVVPTGATVTIRGRTLAQNSTKPVTITLTWLRSLAASPKGGGPPARHLTTPYRPDGTYSTSDTPEREGQYRATSVSPDGTGRDSIEFSVTDQSTYLAAQADVLKAGLDAASDEVDEMIRVVTDQQPSPAQRDALPELAALKAALANRNAAVEQYRSALDTYGAIASADLKAGGKYDIGSKFRSGYSRLDEWHTQTALVTTQLKETLTESKKANVVCDQLIIVEEGFKLANTMFTLLGGFTKALSFFSEASPYTGPFRDLSFKAKAFAGAGNLAVNAIPGTAAKVARFATSYIFNQYCQKFEGPITGHMRVQYYHEGEMWWKSTVDIEGQMTLAYRKGGDPKQPVALKGHIVGTGTKFTVWEQALRVLKRKLLQGGIVAGRTVAPAGIPYTSVPGAMALQAAPTAFFMAVDGTLKDGKLLLTIGPARTDFNEYYTRARGGYVVGGTLSMNVVYFTTFEIQYDNAHGLVDKATDGAPLEIPVVIEKDRMTAEKTFKGERGKVLAKGFYDLNVKVCNPGC